MDSTYNINKFTYKFCSSAYKFAHLTFNKFSDYLPGYGLSFLNYA